MKTIVAALAVASLAAGCATQPLPAASVEYKTQVIDTSCATFKLILVPKTFLAVLATLPPEQRATFDPLGVQILSHDQSYKAKCAVH